MVTIDRLTRSVVIITAEEAAQVDVFFLFLLFLFRGFGFCCSSRAGGSATTTTSGGHSGDFLGAFGNHVDDVLALQCLEESVKHLIITGDTGLGHKLLNVFLG